MQYPGRGKVIIAVDEGDQVGDIIRKGAAELGLGSNQQFTIFHGNERVKESDSAKDFEGSTLSISKTTNVAFC